MSMLINPYAFSSAPAGFDANDWANCTMWLDGTDIDAVWQNTAGTTAVTADAQTVRAITNKASGAPGSALFTTASTLVTWRSSLVNGKAGLEAAGVNGAIAFTEANTSFDDASHFVTASAKTMFIVVRPEIVMVTGANEFGRTRLLGDGPRYLGLYIGQPAASTPTLTAGNWDGNKDVANSAAVLTNWQVVSYRHNGTNVELRINDGSWVSVASGNTTVLTGPMEFFGAQGGTNAVSGSLRYLHAIVYSDAKSNTDCDAIVAALMSEAGL